MAKKRYRSRLAKQESKRFMRQTGLIVAIIIGLIAVIIFVGIPALIKLSIFLGNTRASDTGALGNDVIPPAPPQITSPPQATSSAVIAINGFAEAESTVTLFVNGSKTDETLATENGEFSFPSIDLEPGENTLYTKALDAAENESAASTTQTVTVDTEIPEIDIASPQDNQRFFGNSERTVDIVGQTEKNAEVKINDRFVLVNSQGNFSTSYQLENGENKITIKAIDIAGNTAETSLTLHYSD